MWRIACNKSKSVNILAWQQRGLDRSKTNKSPNTFSEINPHNDNMDCESINLFVTGIVKDAVALGQVKTETNKSDSHFYNNKLSYSLQKYQLLKYSHKHQ